MIIRRNTKTKDMVMEVLKQSSTALCHEDIEKTLENKITRVTIYRILQSFEEDGVVHKIADETGKWHYALCSEDCSKEEHFDNHIHFQCTECGVVSCLDFQLKEPELPKGYILKEFSYLVSGFCPNCHPAI